MCVCYWVANHVRVILALVFSSMARVCIIISFCLFSLSQDWILYLKHACCISTVSLPGPILFGAIFDSTCRVWQQSCDVTGSCWIYDNSSLAVRTLAGVLAFKALSLVFLTVASVVYKAPRQSLIDMIEIDDSTADCPSQRDNASGAVVSHEHQDNPQLCHRATDLHSDTL